jgi:hypothetical protein
MADTKDLKPQVRKALEQASKQYMQKYGKPLPISSAFRTLEEQKALYNNRANNPYPVARPGTSNHEHGFSVDVTDPNARKILEANGFKWFGPGDEVHYDFAAALPAPKSPLLAKAEQVQAKTKAGQAALAQQAAQQQQQQAQSEQMQTMLQALDKGTQLQIQAEKNSISAGKEMPAQKAIQDVATQVGGMMEPQLDNTPVQPGVKMNPQGNLNPNGVMPDTQEAISASGMNTTPQQDQAIYEAYAKQNPLQGTATAQILPGDMPIPTGKNPTTQTNALANALKTVQSISGKLGGQPSMNSGAIPNPHVSMRDLPQVSYQALPNVWGTPQALQANHNLYSQFIQSQA